MTRIRVPRLFIDDHIDRELPTPELTHEVGGSARQYVIDTDDPNLAELIDDARYYATDVDEAPRSVILAARRLLERLSPYVASALATAEAAR